MKTCKKCERELLDDFKVCPYCGECVKENLEKGNINHGSELTSDTSEVEVIVEEKGGDNSEDDVKEKIKIGKKLNKRTKNKDAEAFLKENKRKNKRIVIALVVVFFSIICICGYKEYQAEQEAAREQAQEQLANTYREYVLDCQDLVNNSFLLKMYGAVFSDDLMKVWSKHIYGGLDEAIDGYMNENKKSVENIKKQRDEAKDLYFNKISTIPDILADNTDIQQLNTLCANLNKSQNEFIEITLNPLGNYESYSADRMSKYNKYKSDYDELCSKVKAIVERDGIKKDDSSVQ